MRQETNLLGLTRATKKLEYWQELKDKGVTEQLSDEDGTTYEVWERIGYWERQIFKYKTRIEKHIQEIEKIKNPLTFITWVSGIVETIKEIIQTLTKIKL